MHRRELYNDIDIDDEAELEEVKVEGVVVVPPFSSSNPIMKFQLAVETGLTERRD
jgi:hypothetical protein